MADRENLREMAAALGKETRTVASELDYHLWNSRIVCITGTSVAFVSAVAAATIGFALTPFTLGASAVLVWVGAAGAVTAGGASLAQTLIKLRKVKHVQRKLSAFQQALTDDLTRDPEPLRQFIEKWNLAVDGREFAESTSEATPKPTGRIGAAWQKIKQSKIFRVAAKALKIAGSVGGAILKTFKKAKACVPFLEGAFRLGSSVMSRVLIVSDLATITYMGLQLYEGNGSETGRKMKVLADALDEFSQTGELSASAIQGFLVQLKKAED